MTQLIYKNLLNKSIEAITMAIEIYNKPLTKYRSETSTILIINAWENSLKALISKNRWAIIYNRKTQTSKTFEDCIACVKSNLGKKWHETWADSLLHLYKERCKVLHYNRGLEVLDFMLIQQNILFLKEFIDQNFGVSIIKDKNWYILPIGTEIPLDQFNLLTFQSSIQDSPNDVKEYFKQIIEIHNKHAEHGNSILLELNVSLQNVSRISQSDMVIGVDPSNPKKASLSYESLKLDKAGKSITVQEFQKIIENYPLRYNEMLNEYKKILIQRKMKFDQKELNEKMKQIKKDTSLSYNWSNLSTILPIKISETYSYSRDVINKLLL